MPPRPLAPASTRARARANPASRSGGICRLIWRLSFTLPEREESAPRVGCRRATPRVRPGLSARDLRRRRIPIRSRSGLRREAILDGERERILAGDARRASPERRYEDVRSPPFLGSSRAGQSRRSPIPRVGASRRIRRPPRPTESARRSRVARIQSAARRGARGPRPAARRSGRTSRQETQGESGQTRRRAPPFRPLGHPAIDRRRGLARFARRERRRRRGGFLAARGARPPRRPPTGP